LLAFRKPCGNNHYVAGGMPGPTLVSPIFTPPWLNGSSRRVDGPDRDADRTATVFCPLQGQPAAGSGHRRALNQTVGTMSGSGGESGSDPGGRAFVR